MKVEFVGREFRPLHRLDTAGFRKNVSRIAHRVGTGTGRCKVSGHCGHYMGCDHCAGNPNQFDRLTADEIITLVSRAHPELMGSAFRDWLKRGSAKAKAVIKKMPKPLRIATGIALAPLAPTLATTALLTAPAAAVPAGLALLSSKKARLKAKQSLGRVRAGIMKMPPPLRIAAGIALAPLAPTLATTVLTTAGAAAPGALVAKAIHDRNMRLKNMTPEQRAAENKKTLKRLAIASMFIPGVAPIAAAAGVTALTFKAAQKGVQAIQAAQAKSAAANAAAQDASVAPTDTSADNVVVPSAVKEKVENGETTTAAVQTFDTTTTATPDQSSKKSGLAALLPLAALAIPFLLGD